MKFTILFVLILTTLIQKANKINSIRLKAQLDVINSGLTDELSNLESMFKKMRLINSPQSNNKKSGIFNSISNPSNFRFKESQQNNNKPADNGKGSNNEDIDTTDSLDLNLSISEDPIFSNSVSSKDKELERKEGIKNGNILYSGKRTGNVETSEFADFYYEIIKTV